MGALHTNQCGLVHEEGLVLAAEYGEIALKTVCAAFQGDAALFLCTPPTRHLTHNMPILSFSVSFTTRNMRFCILPRVDLLSSPLRDHSVGPKGDVSWPPYDHCGLKKQGGH